MERITAVQALRYEVESSWWASWIGSPQLQRLAACYFAWKVNRKHGRYTAGAERLRQIEARLTQLSRCR